MTRIFDDPLWEKERLARVRRQEINAAKRAVSEGRVERVSKPGEWRVMMCGNEAVVEIFGEGE